MSATRAAESRETGNKQARSSGEILYIPLPLKSDCFKSALFFIRQYKEKKAGPSSDRSGVFIKLETSNLGLLWIGLFSVPGKGIVVRFIAENQSTRQAINDILPAVKAELKKSGYREAAVSCLVQPNVSRCQDIDPAAANAGVIKSLVDWEV
nr:flagellar hook-length control protein FliK [Desulforadius tongensis]